MRVLFGRIGAIFKVFIVLSALIIMIVVSTLFSFNHFQAVQIGPSQQCTPVVGLAGPEDLQIDRLRRRAFISSYDRRAASSDTRGEIYIVNIDDPLDAWNWRGRSGGTPEIFEPLGLSYYEEGETRRLFVVNAAAKSVELFDVGADGMLIHLETFAEYRLTSPNSVVATGPRSFYVSNDVEAGRGSLLGRWAYLTRSGDGKIYDFNGVSFRLAAEGLKFANGLALSPGGDILYVAESAGMALRAYERDSQNGSLRLLHSVVLPGAADNINVQENGDLLIAAHQKPLLAARHRRSEKTRAPSLVLKVTQDEALGLDAGEREGESMPPYQRLYATDGATFSAATAADQLGDKLLIGAIAEKQFLICDVDETG